MKKILLIALILLGIIGMVFAGCAKPAPAPTPAPAPSPAPAPAPAPSKEPIKIGVMYPLTGPIAITGARMVDAAKFAFEQIGNEIGGRKIEVIVADSGEPGPAVAIDKIRKLVEFDKVSILVGPLTTTGKMSVGSFMDKAGVPQVATHFNNPAMSQYGWSFMPGGSSDQICGAGGKYAYEGQGFKTLNGLTYETGDGRTFYGAFKKGYEKAGGQVVQELYTIRPCPDYAPYLTALKDADAVAAWCDGSDAIQLLGQYHEFGIRQRMPLVAAFFGSFFETFILNSIPPEAAEAMIGEKCATPYTPLLDTEVNKKFVADIKAKFGYVPEEADAGAYLGAQVAIKALQATGGDTTPEMLREAILALDFESMEGHIRIDPKTRFPVRDVYIIEIGKVEGHYAWVPIHTYKNVPPEGL